ncbi:M48 family metallopeptidase [Biformimicrobium ophioploci]|uniref:M48 family metallopeptidase n=1 Tax=Biformimicrobium ophioploci TaxID=3036711 RepID=A0ABQ6M0V3_9GAMM|nr:SprT family zinc-dependent metalloprotease [Microbulbifer sp. NKW57]GMG87975.1 M48 family metallopeptidase [Microbulbifer sp. NKW57]
MTGLFQAESFGAAQREFHCEDIRYRVVRSARRKRVGLVMTAAGVEVRLPMRCAERHGHDFLRANLAWVRRQLQQRQARQDEIPQYQYRFGAHLPWLGAMLPVQRAPAASAGAIVAGDAIRVYTRSLAPDADQLQDALERLYKREAQALLEQKSRAHAARIGEQIASVAVRRTRSKWGHCTSDRRLQYNWLVCQAPEAVVDYLVAHEVSHLRHMNHSPDFWALVGAHCPGYRELRCWLRNNGHRLVL